MITRAREKVSDGHFGKLGSSWPRCEDYSDEEKQDRVMAKRMIVVCAGCNLCASGVCRRCAENANNLERNMSSCELAREPVFELSQQLTTCSDNARVIMSFFIVKRCALTDW